MKVWWCAQQESTVPWGLRECVRADDRETRMPGHGKCGPMRLIPERFLVATVNMGGIAHWMIPVSALNEVAMRLIPDNALDRIAAGVALALVDSELDVNGKWSRTKNYRFAGIVLAALDRETPP